MSALKRTRPVELAFDGPQRLVLTSIARAFIHSRLNVGGLDILEPRC